MYRNDGALVGVSMATGYPEGFETERFGLHRVPRVGTYRGLIFASLAEKGPTLEEQPPRAPLHRPVDQAVPLG